MLILIEDWVSKYSRLFSFLGKTEQEVFKDKSYERHSFFYFSKSSNLALHSSMYSEIEETL